jgi:uncharacterized phage infection (PIP) family protein YhgE
MDFEKAIDLAEEELTQKIQERDEIERRIGQLNLALRGMANMLPEPQKRQLLNRLDAMRRKPSGLTDSIREALNQFTDGMTSGEIKSYLENIGFDLSEYSQPNATISSTLLRLRSNKEIVVSGSRNGGMVFKLKK